MRILQKKEIKRVLAILEETYPDAKPELEYTTAFELLIAVMLSAQCTDKRVNLVTRELFKKYNTPKTMIELTVEELGELIKTAGLYKNKSKNILATCRILIDEYDAEVPDNRSDLERLPGVGRKTASVVLSVWFDIPAIAVDTHVFRVSNRIGIAEASTVNKTENQLMDNIPEKQWSKAHHWLIFHGRRLCKARNPLCEDCPINALCKYYSNIK
ncbi:MAG: endonuclease III [Tissierellales bacterium]|nr:endonuclease III [Tissierellales bacterium]